MKIGAQQMCGQSQVTITTRLVNLLLVLTVMLDFYGYGSYNFSYIASVGLAILCYFKNRGIKNRMPRPLNIYLFYYLIVFYLSVTAISITGLIPLGLAKIFLVCAMFFCEFKYDLFYRYYRVVAIICMLFFFIQYFSQQIFGIKILGIIPGLPLAAQIDESGYLAEQQIAARCSSFFSEPAKFAQFLLPYLCMELYGKGKYRIFLIISSVLCLLLSFSGNALLGLVVVVIYFTYNYVKSNFSIKRLLVLICLGLLILTVSGYYFQSEMGGKVLDRQEQLTETNDNSTTGHSGFMRIYRGYFVYAEYSMWEKIVGINSNEGILAKVKASPVSYSFDEKNLYFNTIQTVLIRTGIIGLFIMLVFLIGLWKKTTPCGRSFILLLVALSAISSGFFTEYMMMYLVVPYYLSIKKKLAIYNNP